MKELSLNILDIAENSVKAGATLTEIYINEDKKNLEIIIKDNGIGMTEATLSSVTNPFYTTRTTRSVGLGIPLFKLSSEMTGGAFSIQSRHKDKHADSHGTTVRASYNKEHIDFTPLGDIKSTLITLIHGHCNVDFLFVHTLNGSEVRLDTREMREILEDIPLNSPEILSWIEENLSEQYNSIFN